MSQTKAQLISGSAAQDLTLATATVNTGSAGSPSITFSSDVNTGIYSPGADQVAISTNGTGRLFVDASGNVGVGQSSPAVYFDIFKSGATQADLRVRNGTSGLNLAIKADGTADISNVLNYPITFTTGVSPTEKLRLTSDGKLGLGTSSPTNILHVTPANASGASATDGVRVSAGTSSVGINIGANSSATFGWIQSSNAGVSFAPTVINPQGGNVGIGTTSPTRTFQVANGSNAIASVLCGSIEGVLNATTANVNVGSASNHDFVISTNGQEAARIDTSRRLLVGTSSTSNSATAVFQGNSGTSVGPATIYMRRGSAPTGNQTLGVFEFSDNSGGIGAEIFSNKDSGTWTSGSSHPAYLGFSTAADGASGPTEKMRIRRNGTIESDNVSGTNIICVNNGATNTALIYFQTSSAELGKIRINGAGVAYDTTSDYRLKENIEPITGAIDRLQALKPWRFNFISHPEVTVDGFLAHEAQEVVPEAVGGAKDEVDADGNPIYQGIDQSKLVPLLTAALQEALQKIEDLEGRLTAAGL